MPITRYPPHPIRGRDHTGQEHDVRVDEQGRLDLSGADMTSLLYSILMEIRALRLILENETGVTTDGLED